MFTLSKILKINALSSGITGLALIIFSKGAASLFAVVTPLAFIGLGLFLTVFALFVFYQARQNPINNHRVKLIIGLDGLWLIGSALAIELLYHSVSTIGLVLIAAVALWVAVMAWLQFNGLQKSDILIKYES